MHSLVIPVQQGQLTFVGSLLFKGNFPCIFQGKRTGSMAQAGTEGSHTCVPPVAIPMLTVQLPWKVFPDIFCKSCSGKLAPALAPSSNLLGLLPLLSFQSRCFVSTKEDL